MEPVSYALAPVPEEAAARALARFLASPAAEAVPEAVAASLGALQQTLADGDRPRASSKKAKRARRSTVDGAAPAR